ncbi:hypothetical protein J6590_043545 [Homalodisca vitripennis]|nr:hypothetical protein J6590_043545 [Homalodisca vitripennis]
MHRRNEDWEHTIDNPKLQEIISIDNKAMDIKTLSDLVLYLEDVTTCSVCLERLDPNMRQCSNGHAFCQSCSTKLTKCPNCEQPLLTAKPIQLVQILERLPTMCTYKEKGCSKISFAGNHEPFCVFRPFSCTLDSCEWLGEVAFFKRHLRENHCRYKFKYESNDPVLIDYSILDENNTYHSIHMVDGNLFVFIVTKDEGKQILRQSVKFIPIKRPQHTYYFSTTFFKSDEIIFKHTSKAEICIKEMEESCHYMNLPLDELKLMVNTTTHFLEGLVEARRV